MSSSKPSTRTIALALAGITLAGVGIRALGIDADRPAARLSFDEDYVVSDAFHLAAEGTIVPNTHFYPPLYTYSLTLTYGLWYLGGRAVGTFESTDDFGFLHFARPGEFHLVARLVTLLFAALTIPVVFLLGRTFRGPAVGLVAAILLAGERVHAERSHYAMPDVPMVLLAALATLGLLWIARHGRRRDFVLAGLFLGLAAATKYNAGLLGLGLPFAWRVAPRPEGGRGGWRDVRPWLYVAAAATAFLLAAPTWILEPRAALAGLAFERANTTVGGHVGWIEGDRWVWIWRQAFAIEPFLLFFLILGLVASFRRATPGTAALVVPCLAGILYIGSWTKQSLHYLLPILPALVVLSADTLQALVEALPERRRFVPFVLAGLAVGGGVRSTILWGLDLYAPDTRTEAARWIEEQAAPGARIAVDSHLHNELPPLRDLRHVREYQAGNLDASPEVRQRIEEYIAEAPLFEIAAVRTAVAEPIVPPEHAATIARHPSLLRHFATRWLRPAELAGQGVEYIVTTSSYRSRFEGTLPSERSILRSFVEDGSAFYWALDRAPEYEEVAVFAAGGDVRGPTIRIYRLRSPAGPGTGDGG